MIDVFSLQMKMKQRFGVLLSTVCFDFSKNKFHTP